jgi:hypothetical protein
MTRACLMNRPAAQNHFLIRFTCASALLEKRFFRRFFPTNLICQTHPRRPMRDNGMECGRLEVGLSPDNNGFSVTGSTKGPSL